MVWRVFITFLIIGHIAHIYKWTPEKVIIMLALGFLFAIIEHLAEGKQ